MSIQKNFQTVIGVTTRSLFGNCANGDAPAKPTGNSLAKFSGASARYDSVSLIDLGHRQGEESCHFSLGLVSIEFFDSSTLATSFDPV